MEKLTKTKPKVKRLRKGMGKVQFIACSEKISELDRQGYDIRKIYEQLFEAKLITMSYSAFYENFRNRTRDRRKKPEKTPNTLQSSPPNQIDAEDKQEKSVRNFSLPLQKKVDEAIKRSLSVPDNDDPEIRALKEGLF